MQNLADLKKRLENLPAKRQEKKYKRLYRNFLEKAVGCHDKLKSSSQGINLTAGVVAASSYSASISSIGSASKTAARLGGKLLKDSDAIASSEVEADFTALSDKSASAQVGVNNAWESELQGKIKDWEAIQDVVVKLMPTQGKRLKKSIASLQSAKRPMPTTKLGVSAVKDSIEELKDSVANLELDGNFGDFLKAAVSLDGADVGMVEDPEVSKVIAKHKLQKVFRVRIS